jgi:zinc transporter
MGDTNKACLISYRFDGQGAGIAVDPTTILPGDGRLSWVHLNGRSPDSKKFMKEHFHLDPLIVKPLTENETRPRIEDTPGGMLLILRGINFNPGPAPEDMVSLRLWIGGNHIISISPRKSAAVLEMDERIKGGRGPKTVGEFVALLCSLLNDGIEPAIDDLENQIDELEDLSLDAPDNTLRDQLAMIRKQATQFRRHTAPQRDVINRLMRTEQPWMSSPTYKWMVQDSHDRITRFIENLDVLRERAQILQDELNSALSAKLNRNIYILSVITAIFMPLTFLTGLLGMNVQGIPHAESPNAFVIVCGIAAVIGVIQLGIFRRLKWF